MVLIIFNGPDKVFAGRGCSMCMTVGKSESERIDIWMHEPSVIPIKKAIVEFCVKSFK